MPLSRVSALPYVLAILAIQQFYSFYHGLVRVRVTGPLKLNRLPIYQHERGDSDVPVIPACSQTDRLQYIRDRCPTASQNRSMEQFLDGMSDDALRALVKGFIVNEEHKLIACLHFKVGSSTWNAIFINNSINRPPESWMFKTAYVGAHYKYSDFGLHMLDKYPSAEIKRKLLDYYKFMVVRHPLSRLVSVYRDKLRDDNTYYCQTMGAKLLAIYRPHLPAAQREQGKGVRFDELARYIVNGGKDEHWAGPYDRQCRPCDIHYDHIVKLETFREDARPIVARMRGRGLETENNGHRNKKPGIRDVLAEYQNVSAKTLRALVTQYKSDFLNFGYTFSRGKDKSLNVSCKALSASGEVCC